MAQKSLDTTGNEPMGVAYAKINDNFAELYGNTPEFTDWSGVSVTATGAISGGSVSTTGQLAGGSLQLDSGTKTATATAGAATLNKDSGKITTESLTTAKGAEYTLTLTNSAIAAADMVFASVALGTATTGLPMVTTITPAAGSVVIKVLNNDANDALNGTLKISFMVLKN